MPELPPFLPFLLAAALCAVPVAGMRRVAMLAAPVLGLASVLAWTDAGVGSWRVEVAGLELELCTIDGLGGVFAGLFCVAAFLAALYSLHERGRLQGAMALLYAGAAVGAVVAGDLVTLFAWLEVMALASTVLVCARGTQRSYRAAGRYLLWQLASGLLLLGGALLRVAATGAADLEVMALSDPGALLVFAALGVKAAFPFVHAWLTDAYPESSPAGTVWLSAFTTKVAVYGLARLFPGCEALVWIGAAMTCFPIFYAVIENDLRRVLAYSLVNQVGFMVCGIGLGTELALAGAVAHACNDVVFKGLLFMATGAVLHQTHRIGASELGGLWRSMPRTTAFCIVGAASISAFPLFSGFVSKSLIMVAALDGGYGVIWLCLLFASAGVFHHAGIKIPYFAFFGHDSGLRPSEPPRNMLVAMAAAAVLCVLAGCAPTLLYAVLPFSFSYHPYDATHVIAQLQLLCWSALAFAWLRRRGYYPPELPATNLDADWFLRRGMPVSLRRTVAACERVLAPVRAMARALVQRSWRMLMSARGPRGPLARSLPTDSVMLWMALLLGALLILFYA